MHRAQRFTLLFLLSLVFLLVPCTSRAKEPFTPFMEATLVQLDDAQYLTNVSVDAFVIPNLDSMWTFLNNETDEFTFAASHRRPNAQRATVAAGMVTDLLVGTDPNPDFADHYNVSVVTHETGQNATLFPVALLDEMVNGQTDPTGIQISKQRWYNLNPAVEPYPVDTEQEGEMDLLFHVEPGVDGWYVEPIEAAVSLTRPDFADHPALRIYRVGERTDSEVYEHNVVEGVIDLDPSARHQQWNGYTHVRISLWMESPENVTKILFLQLVRQP